MLCLLVKNVAPVFTPNIVARYAKTAQEILVISLVSSSNVDLKCRAVDVLEKKIRVQRKAIHRLKVDFPPKETKRIKYSFRGVHSGLFGTTEIRILNTSSGFRPAGLPWNPTRLDDFNGTHTDIANLRGTFLTSANKLESHSGNDPDESTSDPSDRDTNVRDTTDLNKTMQPAVRYQLPSAAASAILTIAILTLTTAMIVTVIIAIVTIIILIVAILTIAIITLPTLSAGIMTIGTPTIATLAMAA
ncbi:uncharacterized protein LOC143361726 [Halictus rubicundus]|uniref:uncharacterized protein LOC143361726 n=1 Tax=Halictus rubicundus TaxID=77578 RepID=UPI004035CBAF